MSSGLTIDATALTPSTFEVAPGPSGLPTGVPQSLVLAPGSYTFKYETGPTFGFSVDGAGTVQYDASFDGFLAGRGTTTLTINGVPLSVNATALTPTTYQVRALITSPTSVEANLTVIPGSYLFKYDGAPFFAFNVDNAGLVTYDAGLEDFLDGSGTSLLTVQGFPIFVDARGIASEQPEFDIGSGFPITPALDATLVQELRIIPSFGGGYFFRFVGASPASGSSFFFEVDNDGLLQSVPASFVGYDVAGTGTATLSLGPSLTCGITITTPGTTLTLDADLVCPAGFTGTALTIAADNVTVDGAGFAIVAPSATQAVSSGFVDGLVLRNLDLSSAGTARAVLLNQVTSATVQNLDLSGPGSGEGIRMESSSGVLVIGNTAHGRNPAIHVIGGDNNAIEANDVSNNPFAIRTLGGGNNNRYVANDVSSSTSCIALSEETDFTLAGNDYTDCTFALDLGFMDGFVLENIDFSGFNISSRALLLNHVTNATIQNLNLSGAAGGEGIRIESSSGLLVTGNTVHNRSVGINNLFQSHNNLISANNLTDNGTGINSSLPGPRIGNQYIANDVSRSTNAGLTLTEEEGAVVRDNVATASLRGIILNSNSGPGNVIAANDLSFTVNAGLRLEASPGVEVKNNLIAHGSGNGLVLIGSPAPGVFHNNIFGNAGLQVSSDAAVELSVGTEGNFWGRECPGPLFVPGVDSNRSDAEDSFPYRAQDAWLSELNPGCGPPPTGDITGTVTDGAGGVPNVTISLTDSGEVLQGDTTTASNGTYVFPELEPGDYTVAAIQPIGYLPTSPTEIFAAVASDMVTVVDFRFERVVSSLDTRTIGFWKHQLKANLTGRGNAHESESALFGYLDAIQAQYDIFDGVIGLEGMDAVLDPPKPPTMRERAEQQLMALLLNLASLRIATYTSVSADDLASEAIDLVIAILADGTSPPADLELAKDLADDLNNGVLPLAAERIPEP